MAGAYDPLGAYGPFGGAPDTLDPDGFSDDYFEDFGAVLGHLGGRPDFVGGALTGALAPEQADDLLPGASDRGVRVLDADAFFEPGDEAPHCGACGGARPARGPSRAPGIAAFLVDPAADRSRSRSPPARGAMDEAELEADPWDEGGFGDGLGDGLGAAGADRLIGDPGDEFGGVWGGSLFGTERETKLEPEREPERGTEREPEREPERGTEREPELGTERGTGREPEHGAEREAERGGAAWFGGAGERSASATLAPRPRRADNVGPGPAGELAVLGAAEMSGSILPFLFDS
ncbi:MAG TPA: hypothetical protein VNI01_03245 [Elusimicrobiota bacterium]|nr:hypothetical protein [Elusimicrobiota bacterium]